MKTRKKGLWVLPLAALLAGIFFLSFLIGRYRVPALQVLRLLTDCIIKHIIPPAKSTCIISLIFKSNLQFYEDVFRL